MDRSLLLNTKIYLWTFKKVNWKNWVRNHILKKSPAQKQIFKLFSFFFQILVVVINRIVMLHVDQQRLRIACLHLSTCNVTFGLMITISTVEEIQTCQYIQQNQFFRENVFIIAFSELRPGSNERYENSTFYGPFRFLVFILIFDR